MSDKNTAANTSPHVRTVCTPRENPSKIRATLARHPWSGSQPSMRRSRQRRTMQSKVHKPRNSYDRSNRKRRARRASRLFRRQNPSLPPLGVRRTQKSTSQSQRVPQSRRHREFARAHKCQTCRRSAILSFRAISSGRTGSRGSAQKKERAKPCQGHRINIPESRWTHVRLKPLPSQSPHRVACVNGDRAQGKGKEVIRAVNRRPKLGAAELAQMQQSTRTIGKESHNKRKRSQQPLLPRRKSHMRLSLARFATSCKHTRQCLLRRPPLLTVRPALEVPAQSTSFHTRYYESLRRLLVS